jgi:hypothetical protein
MDSYFVMMLLILGYLVFGLYHRDDRSLDTSYPLHWVLVLTLLIMPMQNQLKFGLRFTSYDANKTHKVMGVIQSEVDHVNAEDGEILFVTQRHLIALGTLKNVTLVPEYEREDLMEMAMGHNEDYLQKFRQDMDDQRFASIVVDPLSYALLSKRRSFSEENNVWVLEIMRPILCNYQLKASYPEDDIAIYVPQEGERQCPQ